MLFIYTEQGEPVVKFAPIYCGIDTKLETVWNRLIVYNMLCACAVPREGARCIPDLWEDFNLGHLMASRSGHKNNCRVPL